MQRVKIYVTFILLFIVFPILSQSILNQLITLDYRNTSAKIILQSIHDQSGAIFSYSDFDDQQLMSIQKFDVPLKDVINSLEIELSVKITIKEKYLIIHNVKQKEKIEMSVQGVILESNSSQPLSDASIYVKKHKILVNTGRDGKFSFKVPNDAKQLKINIAKENYIDTSVIIVVSKNQNLNIAMRSFPRRLISEFDSLASRDFAISSIVEQQPIPTPSLIQKSYNESFWERQKMKYVNLNNINDTILNIVSISLLPPISTNKLLSYNTRNNVSINILGGNSKGINGVELGGIFNYDDGKVNGVQISGIVNLVSDDLVGTQIGGIFNGVKGDMRGAQIAGILNLNDKTTKGLQLSGVGQQTRSLEGIQMAGIYNKAKTAKGLQISGICNVVDSATTQLQISGIYNKAANVKGLQISGIANYCDTLTGIQIGLYNNTKHIKGGFAVGFINYVKDGYNKLELSYNELGTSSIGYRSGWAPLHFHYFVGANLKDKTYKFVQAGIGLASSTPINKRLSFQADINVRQSFDVDAIAQNSFNMYSQALIGISWQLTKKVGIRTGLTLNHVWYNPTSEINRHIVSLVNSTIYTNDSNNRIQKMWLGWQVGILLL